MEESQRPLAPHVNCTAGEQYFFPQFESEKYTFPIFDKFPAIVLFWMIFYI